MNTTEIETKAKLRNEIRALSDAVDRAAGANLGTALGTLQGRMGFPALHEATVEQLTLMRGWLCNWRELLPADE